MQMRQYIRHPSEIPIEIVALDAANSSQHQLHDFSCGGLRFDSQTRLPKGSNILIRINLEKESFEIQAHVVWCHKVQSGYEIGVVFHCHDEAYRMRMVEQLCHIEQYRQQMEVREGRMVSSEEAAFEWIDKYAEQFPRHG